MGNTGISYARSEISFGQITDGSSHTYLLGEKYLRPEVYVTGGDTADDSGMYEGCAYDTYRWCAVTRPEDDVGLTPVQDRDGFADPNRFGSAHPGGSHFAMCDGSLRVVAYSVSAVLHARLANRSDGFTTSEP